MKKLISALLCIAMMFSLCLTFVAGEATGGKDNIKGTIPRAHVNPTIDGIIDGNEWKGAFTFTLNKDNAGKFVQLLKPGQVASTPASAKISMMWYATDEGENFYEDPDMYFSMDYSDTDGIYILAEVTDCTKAFTVGDDLSDSRDTPAANSTDCVQVVFDSLDTDNTVRTNGFFCYTFQPYTCITGGNGTVAGGKATFWEHWSFQSGESIADENSFGTDVASVVHFEGVTDEELAEYKADEFWFKDGSEYVNVTGNNNITGYTMEMFIPFYLITSPVDGDDVALNPFVADATTGIAFVLIDYLFSGDNTTAGDGVPKNQGINAGMTDICSGYDDDEWTEILEYGDMYPTYNFGDYPVAPAFELGDVDLSGGLPTISDALLLFKHVAGVEFITNADALAVADVDTTEGVTIADALELFKYVAGVSTELSGNIA